MESLRARRRSALFLISGVLTTAVGAACTHGTTTTTEPLPSSFEVREVVATQVGQDALATHPFTTGVIGANDPYRNAPAFTEAPPDAAGDLVTYADANGDGFYTRGRDPKYLLGPAGVTADDVDAASAAPFHGAWTVMVHLDAGGTRALRTLTSRLVGRQLAIVFDRLVISAPTVQSPIDSGQIQIAGSFGEQKAKQIAAALQSA